ncbi:protein SSP120 [Kluyveromyces marxianus]|nr:protein SSP120 [Kluyveromyces marxianus]BAP70945.1 protein SSP120 [Kluyveromyces marxianus]
MKIFSSIIYVLLTSVIAALAHSTAEAPPDGMSWEEWHMREEHEMSKYTPEQFFDMHDMGNKGYFDAKDIINMYGLQKEVVVGKGDGMGQNDESQEIDDGLRERVVKFVMALLDVDDDTRITRKEYLDYAAKGNKFVDLGVGVGHHGDFETEYEMHHWNQYHKDQDPDIKNVHKEDVEHELLHHEHEVEESEQGPAGATKGSVITDDEMESRIEKDRIPKKYRAN